MTERRSPDLAFLDAGDVDLAYWRSHPLVASAEAALVDDDDGHVVTELRLWLTSAAADAHGGETSRVRPGARSPRRPPDINLGGRGEPHVTLWSYMPRTEHLELYRDIEGWAWAARAWIKP